VGVLPVDRLQNKAATARATWSSSLGEDRPHGIGGVSVLASDVRLRQRAAPAQRPGGRPVLEKLLSVPRDRDLNLVVGIGTSAAPAACAIETAPRRSMAINLIWCRCAGLDAARRSWPRVPGADALVVTPENLPVVLSLRPVGRAGHRHRRGDRAGTEIAAGCIWWR
jgi:hypothetical protein